MLIFIPETSHIFEELANKECQLLSVTGIGYCLLTISVFQRLTELQASKGSCVRTMQPLRPHMLDALCELYLSL